MRLSLSGLLLLGAAVIIVGCEKGSSPSSKPKVQPAAKAGSAECVVGVEGMS